MKQYRYKTKNKHSKQNELEITYSFMVEKNKINANISRG